MSSLTTGFGRPTTPNVPMVRRAWAVVVDDVATVPAATANVITTDITMVVGKVFVEIEIIESSGKKLWTRQGFENDSVNYIHRFEALVSTTPANEVSLLEMDNKRVLIVAEGNNGSTDKYLLGELSKGLIVKTAESTDEADNRTFLLIAEQGNYSHMPYKYEGVITTA
uniref:hypothetical protein n=1 Tax=Roseivirga sp. TaxID=1964215 RepID=UPI004047AD27